MPTTQPHLEFTDTVSSVKLMDSAATTPALIAAMNYRLSFEGWAPKVARRNKNPLGAPYMPVQEEIQIDIKGATPDICYAKLQVLNSLLDQGERWYNNEIVLPVLLRYQPLGSVKTTYMSDVVFGGMTDDSNAEMVTLPDDFNMTGYISFLRRVKVRFWRRNGIWLCETETLTHSAVAQGTTGFVTWSDFAPVLSPIDIEIGGTTANANYNSSGVTLVAHNDSYIKVFAGTALTGGGANVNDAANFPTFAQIKRFTANGSATLTTLTSMPIKECEYYAVYAKVRNNSVTTIATIRAVQVFPQLVGPYVKVAAGGTAAVVIFLGIFPTRGRTPGNVATAELDIEVSDIVAAGIDIDSITVLMLNRASNVIKSAAVPHPTIASTNHIQIRNRLLLEPQALYAINVPPADTPHNYDGNLLSYTGGIGTVKEAAVLEYHTGGASWNILNTASSAKISIDYKVTRYKAYLVPE